MWRSLQVLVLALTLAACSQGGTTFSPEELAARDARIRAEATENMAPAATAENPAPVAPAPPEPTHVDSGVIREYCVNISFVTHFRPGSTEEDMRTLADLIKQRLCVDGAPRDGSVSGRDAVPRTGQEIEWTAVYR